VTLAQPSVSSPERPDRSTPSPFLREVGVPLSLRLGFPCCRSLGKRLVLILQDLWLKLEGLEDSHKTPVRKPSFFSLTFVHDP